MKFRMKFSDLNQAMQQIKSRIFSSRNYVTRTKNLYEVLACNRLSTAVSYLII